TQRAARALGEALRRASGAPSAILPQITPLGAFEPTQDSLLFEAEELAADAPPAISELSRRMVLTELVLAWSRALRGAIISIESASQFRPTADPPLVVASPAQAFSLAGDLAALIDDMTIEGVPWDRLTNLAPGDFDAYWRITLDFLKIAAAHWPQHLRERGLVDNAERGAILVEHEIARLEAGRFPGPVIVAGSTGARRATARLIAAVANAPRGAVVLPDIDLALEDEAWRMILDEEIATHPQAGLARLLVAIGATRDDVREIGRLPPALSARARLLSEALRPANSTERWRRRSGALASERIEDALRDVSMIEAADESEEALALAIALREILETPGKTAALITPDLDLTRRVRAELLRWGVAIEDSAGRRIGETLPGVLAKLVLAAAQTRKAPELLALLAHPLARLSRPTRDIVAAARALEIGAFRGALNFDLGEPERVIGAAQSAEPAGRENDLRSRLSEADWRAAGALLADIRAALAPLDALGPAAQLASHIEAHRRALEALCRDETGADLLAASPDGARLAALLDEWRDAAPAGLAIGPSDYRALFDKVAGQEPAPDGARRAGPLQILGLLEARLLSFDVALIAGLDETIWPPAAETDAFLNRPMRAALSLSPPERRIGQTAHDFVAALGAPQAILSRARKRGGAPTVPSRFLQRLLAAAGEKSFGEAVRRGEFYLALARRIDRPVAAAAAKRPEPRPSVALRPTRLSVTRIETLRRDPYAIFAERILALKPLDPINPRIDGREIGILWHAALAEFAKSAPTGPPDAERRALISAARAKFARLLEDDSFRLLAWPRIEQGLDYFLGYHRSRRPEVARLLVEEQGSLAIALANGSNFSLTAIADRIEILADGEISLVDFKTGTLPGPRDVRSGFSPQLTLQAAMIARGAFENAPLRTPSSARYLKLGGAQGGDDLELEFRSESFAAVVEEHFAALVALLDQFSDERTPFLSRPYPKFVGAYGVYDHLARIKEWSAAGGLDDDEGEAA
ncbi:MAG TPA: double-strand break repair protein AddB, partial [Roseiarcus sp.]|nr:double-strand break repair protein AddB [Roseiarcus sp.]